MMGEAAAIPMPLSHQGHLLCTEWGSSIMHGQRGACQWVAFSARLF